MHFWVPRVEKRKKESTRTWNWFHVVHRLTFNLCTTYWKAGSYYLLHILHVVRPKINTIMQYAVHIAWVYCILNELKLWFCFTWKLNPVNVFQFSRTKLQCFESLEPSLFYGNVTFVFQSPSRVNSCVTTVIHAEELGFFATPTLQKHF